MMENKTTHPYGTMRRKEREIKDENEIAEILHTGKIMHLALSDHDWPFLVPVFYAYSGNSLYFHSAKTGTKIEIMKKNKNVCFEVSIDNGIVEAEAACDFEAKHRTVIGFGKCVFVEDEEEKIKALNSIVAKFTTRKFEFPKTNLNVTTVVRIEILSMKGKKHGI